MCFSNNNKALFGCFTLMRVKINAECLPNKQVSVYESHTFLQRTKYHVSKEFRMWAVADCWLPPVKMLS